MRRARTPLWRFAVAAMPYGSFNGAVAVSLPYLLRRQGLSVERIAAIAAFVQAPAIWYVLWAPMVDFRFRRRSWIVGLSLTTAICAALAFSQNDPAEHSLGDGAARARVGVLS